MRVLNFFRRLKKSLDRYLHEISMFTFIIFPQGYLSRAPKLNVPKIGILVSKRTLNTP